MKNYPKFYQNIIEKYSKIYPKSNKMLKYIFEHQKR